jgi:hypothetical protein
MAGGNIRTADGKQEEKYFAQGGNTNSEGRTGRQARSFTLCSSVLALSEAEGLPVLKVFDPLNSKAQP